MSFTKVFLPNQLWEDFMFFAFGGTNGGFIETVFNIQGGKFFRLAEVRLNLSVIHASVEDFAIRLSADNAQGSAFNQVFLSQAVSDVKEILWIPSRALIFQSDDHVVFSMALGSGTNIYGLSVFGWSIRG